MIRCRECKVEGGIQAVFRCDQYGFAQVESLDFDKGKAKIDWVDDYDCGSERFECRSCGNESECLDDIAEEVSEDEI